LLPRPPDIKPCSQHIPRTKKTSPHLPCLVRTSPTLSFDTVEMFYCWSHGLGFNPKHTSHTCNTKTDGHKMMLPFIIAWEGSNTIWESNHKNEKDRSHQMSLLNAKILV
jgi:hypothetical protein